MVNPTLHRERLVVPWWAWPAGVLLGVVLGVELALGAPGLRGAAIAGGAALALVALVWLSRIRVQVDPGHLRVDDANLPREFIAGAYPVDAEERRALLGVEADPLAFVIIRPWVRGTVRVDLNDPADPTPYWLISSRRPDRLAAALNSDR
ncbi:DUF3093 domain-containing protein [Luedemannella helvata]|uniref:DUF3093 domain-containing protein n=1 Tax=Luedemannella helvata TaxID=349315 RepID=A0ABN2L009_9ACTN